VSLDPSAPDDARIGALGVTDLACLVYLLVQKPDVRWANPPVWEVAPPFHKPISLRYRSGESAQRWRCDEADCGLPRSARVLRSPNTTIRRK
jgi:hypothetical protein